MTLNPKQVDKNMLAFDALQIMKENSITQLLVMDQDQYFGIIHLHDLLQEGII